MRRRALLALLALPAAGCASTQSRMHRALDPSMEGALRTEEYLFSVSGISSVPSRLTRSDGFIYLSDLAPQMRYLANSGDTARYRALRDFVRDRMLRRDADGLVPARVYRDGAPLQQATPYGYVFLRRALHEAWQNFGDTASAQLLARIKWNETPPSASYGTLYRLTANCHDAAEVVSSDPTAGRRVLGEARRLIHSPSVEAEKAAAGTTAVDGEVAALACLTRLGLALDDPDASVRNLDDLLRHLAPLVEHSGRPDLGTTADVLLTLRRVRAAGPRYYEPPARSRSR